MGEEDTFDQTRQRAINLLESDDLETFALAAGSVRSDEISYDSFWNAKRDDPEQQQAAFLNDIAVLVIMHSRRELSPSENPNNALTTDDILAEVRQRIDYLPDAWFE